MKFLIDHKQKHNLDQTNLTPPLPQSEPLKILPPQSCETTYVTTSQPLMCHSTVGPCTNTLPTSLDYSYTPCTSDQV